VCSSISIDIIRGKYDNPNDTGQISHFQALTSALSATIGLGNIAGVAVAVSLGGPGAVFWMVFIAFFRMTAKFVSCTLGQLYRKVNDDGSISGGPMYYLDKGLEERGYGHLGKFLGALYAIFIIGGAFGGGNMFQANQSYRLFGELLGIPAYLYGMILAVLVAIVIVGGIKRIGQTTEKIVPLMVVLYVSASLFIILTNVSKLPGVLSAICSQAFAPAALYGGFVGVPVTGIKRAVFSNEGGVGSASIAHSAAKTDEPVREGIVAMVGPFIDTIVVCFMTASVILITADINPLYNPGSGINGFISAVIRITDAVIKHTTMVSINGPTIATIPSRTGSSVLAAEWAIDADPTPPSLLNTARLIPVTGTPTNPPYKAAGAKACEHIALNTPGSLETLVKIINSDAETYSTTISGTIFSVV
jgi:amino acid carrier protein